VSQLIARRAGIDDFKGPSEPKILYDSMNRWMNERVDG